MAIFLVLATIALALAAIVLLTKEISRRTVTGHIVSVQHVAWVEDDEVFMSRAAMPSTYSDPMPKPYTCLDIRLADGSVVSVTCFGYISREKGETADVAITKRGILLQREEVSLVGA